MSAVLAVVVIAALALGVRRALPSQEAGRSAFATVAHQDDEVGFRVPALSRLEGLLRTRGTPQEPTDLEAELARVVGGEGRVP